MVWDNGCYAKPSKPDDRRRWDGLTREWICNEDKKGANCDEPKCPGTMMWNDRKGKCYCPDNPDEKEGDFDGEPGKYCTTPSIIFIYLTL